MRGVKISAGIAGDTAPYLTPTICGKPQSCYLNNPVSSKVCQTINVL
jgi:hypothetical protein